VDLQRLIMNKGNKEKEKALLQMKEITTQTGKDIWLERMSGRNFLGEKVVGKPNESK